MENGHLNLMHIHYTLKQCFFPSAKIFLEIIQLYILFKIFVRKLDIVGYNPASMSFPAHALLIVILRVAQCDSCPYLHFMRFSILTTSCNNWSLSWPWSSPALHIMGQAIPMTSFLIRYQVILIVLLIVFVVTSIKRTGTCRHQGFKLYITAVS